MYVKLRNLMSGEQGQDSNKYELLRTIIALAMISSGDIIGPAYPAGKVALLDEG
jgi:Flp pilus assembly pilin Flp